MRYENKSNAMRKSNGNEVKQMTINTTCGKIAKHLEQLENTILSDEDIEQLRGYDAIMLGAIGHPDVKPGVLEKGLLLNLRFKMDQYINLRPVKLYPGVDTPLKDKGPEDIDFDVIRENTEDLYCGNGGILRIGTQQEVATQEMIATRFGAERCIRYAFDFCRRKKEQGTGKGLLTLVHKTNVLTYAGDLWFRAFNEIGEADYPDIQRDYNHVDACCMWFVKNPEYYDTIVVPNMFGDIITDLGAMIQGGMGIAAGGNINPDPGGTSMYEPIGGSAPKYTGQGIINQTVGYLMRSGRPDSLDLMVARNYAVMAADLALEGASGRMISLRGGTYTHVPISVTGEGLKRVDVTELYDSINYRPKVRHVAGKPMFLY